MNATHLSHQLLLPCHVQIPQSQRVNLFSGQFNRPPETKRAWVGLTGRYDGGFRFILYTWMSSWR